MDEQKRLALVRLLEPYLDDQQWCYQPKPLVPLELFFDGNDDEGALGCNLVPHPGIEVFRSTLLDLREDDLVSGVWVCATQHDWKPSWPHADEVIIRTCLDEIEVAARLEHLQPDTVDAVVLGEEVYNDVTGCSARCGAGERHIVVWWD